MLWKLLLFVGISFPDQARDNCFIKNLHFNDILAPLQTQLIPNIFLFEHDRAIIV